MSKAEKTTAMARRTLSLLPAVLLLAGCAVQGDKGNGRSGVAAAPFAVGNNAAQESCIAGGAPNQMAQLTGADLVQILCGEWKQPSARIFDAGASSGLRDGGWAVYRGERFTCQAGDETRILGDVPATLYNCNRRNGGWPHIAIAATVGGRLYLADGVPASVPAIETTIGQLSGRLAKGEAATGAEALRFVQANTKLGGNVLYRFTDNMRAGRSYMGSENYPEAQEAFARALAVYREANDAKAPGAIDALLPLALSLSNQGSFREAQRYMDEADALLAGAERSVTHIVYLAMHYANQKRYDQALELAEKAKAYYLPVLTDARDKQADGSDDVNGLLRRVGRSGDRLSMTVSLGTAPANTSLVQLRDDLQTVLYLEAEIRRRKAKATGKAEDMQAARDVLDTGGPLAAPAIDREIRGFTSRTRGLVLANLNDAEGAYTELTQAKDVFAGVGQTERPLGVTLLRRGQVLLERGGAEQALVDFRAGAEVLRRTNQFTTPDVVEPYLTALHDRLANAGADGVALRAEMLEAAQLVRDPRTAGVIAQAAVRLKAGGRESAAMKDKSDLENQIRRLREERASLPAETTDRAILDRTAEIDEAVRNKETQLADAETAIQASSPGYNILLQTRAKLQDIQAQLSAGEAVASFFLGPTRSFGFLITAGDVRVWRTDMDAAKAASLVERVRKSLKPNLRSQLPAFDVKSARDLYLGLFGPDRDRLAGVGSLLVVAAGPLASLPFGLLIADEPPVGNDPNGRLPLSRLKEVPWLVKAVPVTHFPSLQSLAKLRAIPAGSAAPRAYIAFADAVRPNAAQINALAAANCVSDSRTLNDLPTLPGTRAEVEAVGAILKAPREDIVTGDQFTIDRVQGRVGQALRNYRTIHFASHALLPTELECLKQPAIQISTPPTAANAIDGLLSLEAVEQLDLDADMVVLSACNTAGPDSSGLGESLTGLANGFFYAGARGLVVSHWPANDSAAQLLMTEMFRRMADGRSRSAADAVRATQMAMLTNAGVSPEYKAPFSHPYFWAVFALVGDGARDSRPTL